MRIWVHKLSPWDHEDGKAPLPTGEVTDPLIAASGSPGWLLVDKKPFIYQYCHPYVIHCVSMISYFFTMMFPYSLRLWAKYIYISVFHINVLLQPFNHRIFVGYIMWNPLWWLVLPPDSWLHFLRTCELLHGASCGGCFLPRTGDLQRKKGGFLPWGFSRRNRTRWDLPHVNWRNKNALLYYIVEIDKNWKLSQEFKGL